MTEWEVNGSKYHHTQKTERKDTLPPAIYNLRLDSTTNKLYLYRSGDEFLFDYKIYDLDKKFIDRAVKTYHNTQKNLGLLLYGLKGTGKTVTAKIICNQLKLPVIIISKKYSGVPEIINVIDNDIVVFIDEFDKIYEKERAGNQLLSLMDGVLENGFRRVFMLTTNTNSVNTNLIQRPSRIRYKKEYKNLGLDAIIEIIDDILLHVELRDSVIKFVSQLDIITVDIIKSIVQEVNIHHEEPSVFEDVFNVAKTKYTYNLYRIIDA